MTPMLSTCPPPPGHAVIEIVGAVGVSTRGMLHGPDLGVALEECRKGLRLRAAELGADMVAACHFQVDFSASVVNVTGFGTAVHLSAQPGR